MYELSISFVPRALPFDALASQPVDVPVFYTRVSRRQHAAPAAMYLRPAYYAAWLERQGLEHARCDVINYLREREERD